MREEKSLHLLDQSFKFLEGSALALHSPLVGSCDRTAATQVAIERFNKLELTDDLSNLGWTQFAVRNQSLVLHGANSFKAALKQLFPLRDNGDSVEHLTVEPLVNIMLQHLGPITQLLLLLSGLVGDLLGMVLLFEGVLGGDDGAAGLGQLSVLLLLCL